MLHTPRFRASVRVQTASPDGIYLISEKGIRLLEGELFRTVLPLIDGLRDSERIAGMLAGEASAAEVYYVLLKLEQDGFLTEANGSSTESHARGFWELWSEDPELATGSPRRRCSVDATDAIPLEPMKRALGELDVEIVDSKRSDLRIVLTPDYLTRELELVDREARASGQAWLPVKPTGTELWLGPVFRPDVNGCWHCLAHPLRSNRPAVSYLQAERERLGLEEPTTPPLTYLPVTLSLVANLVALEITKWWFASGRSPLEDTVRVVDLRRCGIGTHRFRPRPQCPHCGEPPSTTVSVGWTPVSCIKRFTSDGGHRCCPPSATFERLRHLISPITGVIQELESVGPAAYGVAPVYFGRTGAPGLDRSLGHVKRGLGEGTTGKGKDDATSRCSVLCEAIERYSGTFQGYEETVKATTAQLEGRSVRLTDCLHFSERQYAMRREINRSTRDPFNLVPRPLRPDEKIDFTAVWSLGEQRFKYLPTAYCYFGVAAGDDPFCWADSNGCAAGNSREEAFLQGFMELVERDSVAIWWYNRIRRPELDLDSLASDYLDSIRECYAARNRELWVLDLTTDLAVPTFAALSCRRNGRPEHLVFGFGAHFDAEVALFRAVTEVHQGVSALAIDAATEDATRVGGAMQTWLETATREDQPHLSPDPRRDKVRLESFERPSHEDLREDVADCVALVGARGMDCLVLDQTRPDVGLPVVRVVVPGLRHFWSRRGPGRLYDVPVEMGWRETPLSELELNPIGIFV